MKFNLNWKGVQEPSDADIDRDVAELRTMLARIEQPADPHPAYWQNFLVKVRTRVDDDKVRRRGFAPSMAWASMTAAALVVVLAVSGLLPTGTTGIVVEKPGPINLHVAPPLANATSIPLYEDGAKSLVLSSDDVQMLDAILEKDEEAILRAMVDADNL